MTDELISRKAVLEIFGDIHPLDYNAQAYVSQIKELPTIPQTNLTYDMVEQYAKENGFVIWTKEQTEETMQKLLNYMNTEKQTNTAEWILCKERLPEECEWVLVYAERDAFDDNGRFRKKVIEVGWQVDGKWHIDGCSRVEGIAWQPLPTPPKVVAE